MSWQNEDGTHEGWDAAVFPGGQVSVGWAAGKGVMVRVPGPDGKLSYEGEPGIIADASTATGWQARCECGWAGPLHPAAPGQATTYADPPGELGETIWQDWKAHLPSPALAEISALTAQIAELTGRLAVKVAQARAAGETWAAIGDAAGMTRQSAHERWGKSVAVLAGGLPGLRSDQAGAD
jgi:hypothetical protein